MYLSCHNAAESFKSVWTLNKKALFPILITETNFSASS
jgi:hypothetical protein